MNQVHFFHCSILHYENLTISKTNTSTRFVYYYSYSYYIVIELRIEVSEEESKLIDQLRP